VVSSVGRPSTAAAAAAATVSAAAAAATSLKIAQAAANDAAEKVVGLLALGAAALVHVIV